MQLSTLKTLTAKARKAETITVFDIGNASIGGAIVDIGPDHPPLVRFAVRKDIPFQEALDLKRFVKNMVDSLGSVATALAAEAASKKIRAPHAIAILSAPWYASQVRKVTLSREAPFKIDERQFAAAVDDETERFKKEAGADYVGKGLEKPSFAVIESTSIGVKLNGYPTEKPFGKTASTLEMTLHMSMAPNEILEAVKEKIELVGKARTVEFNSFSLAYYDIVRDAHPEMSDFILLDVSGEVTEVTLVRHGVLEQTASFPLGKNFLVRGLMLAYNTNAADIFSKLSMHANKEHEARMGEKLHADSSKLALEWFSSFAKTAEVLARGLLLPSHVFFAADREARAWFADAIAAEPPESLFSNKALTMHMLDREFFKDTVAFGENEMQKDPFIAINALFASKIAQKRS